MNGLYLTFVTGHFNLNSTANMHFDYIFYEPILLLIFIFVDYVMPITEESNKIVVGLYMVFMLQTFIKYILFMRSVVKQVCAHLDIPFLTVFKAKVKEQWVKTSNQLKIRKDESETFKSKI